MAQLDETILEGFTKLTDTVRRAVGRLSLIFYLREGMIKAAQPSSEGAVN